MTKKRINIAILEPSQIIFEGLSGIFNKSGQYLKILRLESIYEIDKITSSDKAEVFIINPSQIQNREKDFASIKKNHQGSCWIGLVYTFYEQHMLSMFDKTIHITDATENILEMINKLIESNDSNYQTDEQEQLSSREVEVLKLIIAGLSNKEIADKLFISTHTVVSHRKNISLKTGIKSQSGLTIYAISNKIVQIEDYLK